MNKLEIFVAAFLAPHDSNTQFMEILINLLIVVLGNILKLRCANYAWDFRSHR